jgi:tetratricopeptide (TPR) repeat protein
VSKIGLIRTKILNNEDYLDLEALFQLVSMVKGKLYEGWIRRYMGEILLNIDKRLKSEAVKWFREAIAADERNGTLFELARDYLAYGIFLKKNRKNEEASDIFRKAIELLKDCGSSGWVKKYEKKLATF